MNKILLASFVAVSLSSMAIAGIDVKACVGCHGANFEKDAMGGKSKIVAQMSHAEIAAALKGYKAGTYGGAMKGLMKAQVSKYSDTDLEALAQTIGK